jgi:hypothetical protein
VEARAVTGEISYDLVMDDMDFVEGVFRLPGGEWQVVIVSKGPVTTPEVRPDRWESGAAGFVVTYPEGDLLDKMAVEDVLGRAAGVSRWVEVRGPDSMSLR